ncbi:uncharacterized protein LTR77_007575 [Saxophila tyrrhenica]|uniref:Xylanolytic transcriptional activator regulatory domain-containing protein n=1 Tax=Saxophila tyrrhenica TaxID=1690608 RepID=A0AAV9P2X3_9PEZI|nr:hypothetical protein LTR77_007575 [Saxophila tyrrhenica]
MLVQNPTHTLALSKQIPGRTVNIKSNASPKRRTIGQHMSKLQCVYEDQLPQPSPTFRFVEETPAEPAGPSRTTSQDNEPSPPVTISSNRLQSIKDRVETLGRMVQALQTQSNVGSIASTSRAQSITDVSTPSIQEPEPLHPLDGHLSVHNGGFARYAEPSFWASMAKEVAELDEVLAREARYLLRSGSTSPETEESSAGESEEERPATQRRAGGVRPAALSGRFRLGGYEWAHGGDIPMRTLAQSPEFASQLPPRDVCDRLVANYLRGYHPIVPVIHVPTFRQTYEELWETANTGAQASMSFATLLVAVCYAGSVASSGNGSSTTEGSRPHQVSDRLLKLGAQGLELSAFPKVPTIETLTAYLLLNSTCKREEEPLACVPIVGLALRVAFFLGLHKDPSHYGDTVPAIDAEIRRRVWWHVVHVDTLIATAAGLPPLLDLQAWDVRGISEVKEQFVGTPVGANYTLAVRNRTQTHHSVVDPSQPGYDRSMVSTTGILAAGKLRYTLVMRRTLARLFSNVPLTTTALVAMRSEFKLLGEDLNWRISRIPDSSSTSARQLTTSDDFENNPILNRWARLLLSVYMDQAFSIICHPVLRSQLGYLWPDLYSHLCLKIGQIASTEAFRCFNWSWPGNHQPLNAIMLLLTDLLDKPNSAHAARSRQAIDLVFALLGPDGGIVAGAGAEHTITKRPLLEGGHESWQYLQQFRARVWRNFGLDQSDITTREQAVLICSNASVTDVNVEQGPMWSQEGAEMMDEMTGLDIGEGMQEKFGGEYEVGSPNIDWDYLDAVLAGNVTRTAGEDDDS